MVTENQRWDEAKKEAKEMVEKSVWHNNIRFIMALRNVLQEKLDEHRKEFDEKEKKQTEEFLEKKRDKNL